MLKEDVIVQFAANNDGVTIHIKGSPSEILAALDSLICETAKEFNKHSIEDVEIKPSGVAKMIYCNLLQEEQKEQINKLEDY